MNHHLLRLHVIAIDKAQHIHTRGHSPCRDVARNVCTNDHTPRHIHHLQHPFAIDANLAVAEEREGIFAIIVVVCVPANEHQAETRSVIACLCVEGVGCGLG